MNLWQKIVVVLFSASMFGQALANESAKPKLVIVANEAKYYAEKDGSGLYIEVAEYVLEDEFDVEFKILPPARVDAYFEEGRADGILVADARTYEEGTVVAPDVPFDYNFPLMAIYKKGRYEKWQHDYLYTDRVVGVRNYGYLDYISENTRTSEVPNFRAALMFLKLGRADIYIDYWSDVRLGLNGKKGGAELLSEFDFRPTEIKPREEVVFNDTPKGRKAVELWNLAHQATVLNTPLHDIYMDYSASLPELLVGAGIPVKSEDYLEKYGESLAKITDPGKVTGLYQDSDGSYIKLELDADFKLSGFYSFEEYEGYLEGSYDSETGLGTGGWCDSDSTSGGLKYLFMVEEDVVAARFFWSMGEVGDPSAAWNDDWPTTKTDEEPPPPFDQSLEELKSKNVCKQD